MNGDTVNALEISPRHSSYANLFSYATNDPIQNADKNGCLLNNILSGLIGAIISVLVDVLGEAITYWFKNHFSMNRFKYNFFSWNTALVAASGFASGLIIASKYTRWVCMIGSAVISGLTNIMSCIITGRKFSFASLFCDVAFGLVWGYIGGKGVGNAYWKKNIFSKGGAFVYKGKTYYSSKSLTLIKPVLRDFVTNFKKYILTQIGDWFMKFAKKQIR